MTLALRREALELAESAYALVQADPFKAHGLAEEALAFARANRDAEARVASLHALGYARSRLGDPRALRTMREAVRAGMRDGFAHRAALARRNVALYLAYRGQAEQAMAEIDAARAALSGIDRARTEVFRIAVYERAGHVVAALPDSAGALRVLRRHGDVAWEARLVYNRGAALGEIGELGRAREDLERACELYDSLGLGAAVADARIELARLSALEGDPIRCLAELDAVDVTTLSDWAACWLYLNRAEAFVELRLLPEARADLARFEQSSAKAKAADSVNRSRLEAARLALIAGDAEAAAALASTARHSFAAHGQRPPAAAATVVSLSAAIAQGAVRPSTVRAARRAAADLDSDGRTLEALRAHLLIGHAEAVSGSVVNARAELAIARPLDRRGTVADRIELRHVQALELIREQDDSAAERKLLSGLELLENYRAALGGSDVRATTATIGVELARLGVGLALSTGKPAKVLAWAERLRGNSLRFPAVQPPADRSLRGAQSELRGIARRIREADAERRPVGALAARQAELEATIRTRSRLARAPSERRVSPPTRAATVRALGESALVEYVEHSEQLYAVTLARGRLALHSLGPVDPTTELDWLRFALRRLARGDLDAAGRAATLANVGTAAASLDEQLIAPLLDAVGDRPMVVVPTGVLHAVPWSALPSIRGRAVSIAPSLATWVDLATRKRRRRRTAALVAGPGLRHAQAEIHDIHKLLPASTVLTGQDATVEATLAALDGATLAHVACHGRFRSDSPLFSSLELADGQLTALDLHRLRRAPDILVLSACDVALSERHPGDELLGLSAVLLAAGTRTIVASVVPVPDAAARRLMLDFHRRLAAGASPAAALAAAQAGLRADQSALAGFLCLGVG